MASLDKAFSELLDVVKHLVSTHVRWNQDMDHVTAMAKVDAAKVLLVTGDAANVVDDSVNVVKDAEVGNAASVVTDVQNVASDVKKAVGDAEGKSNG